MKIAVKLLGLSLLLSCFFANPLIAQNPDNIMMIGAEEEAEEDRPLDDIVEKRTIVQKRVLAYDHVREADILWEKRIWRVIDVREKMNLPFSYPERPLFTILMDAAKSGEMTVYSAEDDKFTSKMTVEEVSSIGSSVDTVTTFDPETYEEQIQIVSNDLNPEDVKRFRIKEIWFFDQESSTLQVRIMGIAPLLDERDENGNFKYERPLFWVYYPKARDLLAREQVFNGENDNSPISWGDLFEMRKFTSYIFKASNVKDERIQDYLSGVDRLWECDKIRQEIFNFEHDLWSY